MIGFLPIMPEHLQHSATQEKAQASGTSQILSNDERGSGITKGIVTVEKSPGGKNITLPGFSLQTLGYEDCLSAAVGSMC